MKYRSPLNNNFPSSSLFSWLMDVGRMIFKNALVAHNILGSINLKKDVLKDLQISIMI